MTQDSIVVNLRRTSPKHCGLAYMQVRAPAEYSLQQMQQAVSQGLEAQLSTVGMQVLKTRVHPYLRKPNNGGLSLL